MILVISYQGEDHTTDVVQRLERQGREVRLLDLADFPARLGLILSWTDSDLPSYIVDSPDGRIDLKTAHVAWWRRVRAYMIDDAIRNPALRIFAGSETTQAVEGMLDALPCDWVNPRAADEAAHHKPFQWAAACEVGLPMPRTLVTTKPEDALRFIKETGVGKVVFKAFLATQEAWRETRLVTQDDLNHLDLVRYAPVIFQEYIEGVDLRITAVGDTILAAEIDARKTVYPVDMRMVIGEADIRPVELPPKLGNAVRKLQRRLGLSYGAIDMRRTPEGEYYFFEVNPAGQWLFVEHRTGLPISQTVADLLARRDDRPIMKADAV